MKVLALVVLFFLLEPIPWVIAQPVSEGGGSRGYIWSVHAPWFVPSGFHNLSYFQELRNNGYNAVFYRCLGEP